MFYFFHFYTTLFSQQDASDFDYFQNLFRECEN